MSFIRSRPRRDHGGDTSGAVAYFALAQVPQSRADRLSSNTLPWTTTARHGLQLDLTLAIELGNP